MGVVGPSLRHLRRIGNVSEVKQEVLKEINVGGTKMTSWERICILEKDKYKSFFDEELGLITRFYVHISGIYDEQNNRINNNSLYSKKNHNTNITSTNNVYRVFINTLTPEIFDENYYTLNENNQRYYERRYYGYPDSVSLSEVTELNKIKLELAFEFYLFKENKSVRKTLVISSKQELLDLTVLATKESPEYVVPLMMDLKEGNKYFYISKGVCELEKIYNYPNKKNTLCKLKTINGETFDVLYDDPKFVINPLEEYINELDIFNTNKNELYLQPIISKKVERDTLNVMWQPLEDASRYVIKLYRYINKPGKRKVYHLKDYIVDRNDQLLVISNIVLSDHIVVVCAEDRSGKVIAQSRGIDVGSTDGEPKWW